PGGAVSCATAGVQASASANAIPVAIFIARPLRPDCRNSLDGSLAGQKHWHDRNPPLKIRRLRRKNEPRAARGPGKRRFGAGSAFERRPATASTADRESPLAAADAAAGPPDGGRHRGA